MKRTIFLMGLILIFLSSHSQNYNLITVNGKVGISNLKGDTIINPVYTDIRWLTFFPEVIFVNNNNKWAVFDSVGKKLTPFEFDNIAYFNDINYPNDTKSKFLFGKQYGSWAKIAMDGKLETWYTFSQRFTEKGDLIIGDNYWAAEINDSVMKNEYKDYYKGVDLSDPYLTKVVSHPKRFNIYIRSTLNGMRKGMLNANGDTIIKANFDDFVDNSNFGYFYSKNNGKVGIIDTTGKQIFDCQYDDINYDVNNKSFVEKNNKWALVDNSNKVLTGYIYDDAGNYFSDGLAQVTINKKIGFINLEGKQRIPCQFNNAKNFNNGFSVVYFDKKVSINLGEGFRTVRGITYDVGDVNTDYTEDIPVLINKSGKAIFKAESEDQFCFVKEGYAIVVRNNVDELIDSTGKIILPFENDCFVTLLGDSYFVFFDYSKNSLFGISSYSGKVILKTSFYYITDFIFNENRLAKIYLDLNSYFYVDKNFQCVQFDDISCPDKD